jgi:hypothetical protein
VTRSTTVAEFYAARAAKAPIGSRRLHVYEVEPVAVPEPDAELEDHWTVPEAVMLREVARNAWQP